MPSRVVPGRELTKYRRTEKCYKALSSKDRACALKVPGPSSSQSTHFSMRCDLQRGLTELKTGSNKIREGKTNIFIPLQCIRGLKTCTAQHSLFLSALTREECALTAVLPQNLPVAAMRLPVGPRSSLWLCS